MWQYIDPYKPCPERDVDVLVVLHLARTSTYALTKRERFYSHRWLLDNGYPSMLPDREKPSAERMYPRVVQAVGISCNAQSPIMKPIVPLVQRAMEDVVQDCFANGDTDPTLVKNRMLEARTLEVKRLTGVVLEAAKIRE